MKYYGLILCICGMLAYPAFGSRATGVAGMANFVRNLTSSQYHLTKRLTPKDIELFRSMTDEKIESASKFTYAQFKAFRDLTGYSAWDDSLAEDSFINPWAQESIDTLLELTPQQFDVLRKFKPEEIRIALTNRWGFTKFDDRPPVQRALTLTDEQIDLVKELPNEQLGYLAKISKNSYDLLKKLSPEAIATFSNLTSAEFKLLGMFAWADALNNKQ